MAKMQNLVSLRNTYFGFLLQNEALIPLDFFAKNCYPSGERGPIYRQIKIHSPKRKMQNLVSSKLYAMENPLNIILYVRKIDVLGCLHPRIIYFH